MRRRKVASDYHQLAERRGFVWMGPVVDYAHTNTQWKCKQGHVWEAKYSKVCSGTGCPFCAGNRKKIAADYEKLARRRGFVWLGEEAVGIHKKTLWKCKRAHVWEATYTKIRRGRGCPHCACRVPKRSGDYEALAEQRGFVWLGPMPKQTQVSTMWQCEHGHVWQTGYTHINAGSHCPFCSGRARKVPADYHALAESRGFVWLGPEVRNTGSKTQWKCLLDHVWYARYDDLLTGNGCPECVDIVNGAKASGPQRQLCAMLGGELNHQFDSSKRRIDVALIADMVAVEYDCWYWHGGKQAEDEKRDQELLDAGWRILHVKSNTRLPSSEQLDTSIARLLAGEPIVHIVLPDWGNGPARGLADGSIADLTYGGDVMEVME